MTYRETQPERRFEAFPDVWTKLDALLPDPDAIPQSHLPVGARVRVLQSASIFEGRQGVVMSRDEMPYLSDDPYNYLVRIGGATIWFRRSDLVVDLYEIGDQVRVTEPDPHLPHTHQWVRYRGMYGVVVETSSDDPAASFLVRFGGPKTGTKLWFMNIWLERA